MLEIKKSSLILEVITAISLIAIFLMGDKTVFAFFYISVYILLILRAANIFYARKVKIIMFFTYSFLLILQLSYSNNLDLGIKNYEINTYIGKFISVVNIIFPFFIERFITNNKDVSFYFPSVQEIATLSFNDVKHGLDEILVSIEDLQSSGEKISPRALKEILEDLPRHNIFEYINNGSLTEEYFKDAEVSLNDPFLYLIISNTGSAASEFISVFTKKQFNHASISFDEDLKTIISYNGGENIYAPGLNHEMINFFNKKPNASIIVYKIPVTKEQKTTILNKVREINTEGSAYNLLGLFIKYSHKSNIMHCCQFVYKMFETADICYFEKPDGKIKPTDFVELDYHRRLQFAYELKFNNDPYIYSDKEIITER